MTSGLIDLPACLVFSGKAASLDEQSIKHL
jgi:hypothetical protein